MIAILLSSLAIFTSMVQAAANIPIHPITNVDQDKHTGYFSDPFHVPFKDSKRLYISGTTHQYLECDSSLQPGCASLHRNKYESSLLLNQTATAAGATICSAAGIHPYQSETHGSLSWDALVTLHVQKNTSSCEGIKGWSIIVHAHPENASITDEPPTSWIGDDVLIGSFSERVDANYDGKFFQTPSGQLYLVYQKLHHDSPRRVGVFAWPMDDPRTKTPGSKPTFLLLPDDDLNSENYVSGNASFKLIETGNMRAINGKFLMAYSVGAFNRPTYKLGVAYSDTFLPADGQQYRKVMKNNPHHYWNSQGDMEVSYLLQSDQNHDGWHYVGDQVKAPGVPTIAQIRPSKGWALTFAGYDPKEATRDHLGKYTANLRRPYFIDIEVNVPVSQSVRQASNAELQDWIIPRHQQPA